MQRRAIVVEGIVQGVGFRPFVHGLARRLSLVGLVRNQLGGVWIEVEGEPRLLDRFLELLAAEPPPLARIERIHWAPRPLRAEAGFVIQASEPSTPGEILVSPDVATCDDCLRELFDPSDRRFRYPFLNCTQCGPRLTIVTGAPYDRERTTMAGFAMCPACRAEYDDPGDRRFHAQPTCCPACGPRLRLLDAVGRPIDASDPLRSFAAAMREGRIGAMKGVGGYHLACDARSGRAVAELRRRKHREEKPLAIMVADVEAAERLCILDPAERELLGSRARPIVLLRRRADAAVAEQVAPGQPRLGVMLPYSPLHHLLVRELEGIPLVMTSGNRTDEPIAYEDDDAIERLAGIADLLLTHDRPIHVRCDDSVTRVEAGEESPLRRSRGYAPRPIPLPFECARPILATGGQLKGTFALARGGRAFVSHHLGDLDRYEAYAAFVRDVRLYEELFAARPSVLACDLHPDYASTRYARARAAAEGLELVAVQHHHAHLASCLAEHGRTRRAIGVCLDGTGYGEDGAVWGGEFLVGDLGEFRRAAHLRYVRMPGGDQAIREPWRMALAYLLDAGIDVADQEARFSKVAARAVASMIERGCNAPRTSSMGRLFDAVASLAGVRDRVSHEGQAAVELESVAGEVAPCGIYPFDLVWAPDSESSPAPIVVDTRPMIRAISSERVRSADAARIARRFHSTLVEMIATVCRAIRERTGLATVALSGGVFHNAILSSEAAARLERLDFEVLRHRLVPAGDGGLCLGQLAVAAQRLARGGP